MSLRSRLRDGKFTFIEWALLASFGILTAISLSLSGYNVGTEFTKTDLNFYTMLFIVYLIAECIALILPTKFIPRKFDLVTIGLLCALYIFNIDLFWWSAKFLILCLIALALGSSSGSYSSSGSSSNGKRTGNAKSTTEHTSDGGYWTWIADEHGCLAASAKGPTAEMSQKLASEAYDRYKE